MRTIPFVPRVAARRNIDSKAKMDDKSVLALIDVCKHGKVESPVGFHSSVQFTRELSGCDTLARYPGSQLNVRLWL
jgi:hypothetical protein